MPDDFLHISEATLWDNLKRKANETLRKISNEESGVKRLDYFKPRVDSKTIPKLLEDIGKQFYKLFLYHYLNKQLEKNKEVNIEGIVHNFRFYFWPGYTTLSNKRIFINGTHRGEYKTQRYFTGIGNNPNTIYSSNIKETLNEFLADINHNVALGGFSSSFWVKNIPSVVAFDNILNQKYLDDDIKGNDFNVASTHFWKSSQKVKSENGTFEFIPMPIKKDGSELRILHIKVGNEEVNYYPNRISIGIPKNQFNNSGEIIASALAAKNIDIDWVNEIHKKNYIQWPKQFRNKTTRDSIPMDQARAVETKLQVLSYTYWLSESLNNKRYPNQYYNHIREEFSRNGYEKIAQRIVPFNTFQNSYHQKNKLCEIYYDNWYTAFLESYDAEVDLGTAMFFTSENYDSEFLMKCSNWLRWIYNELRILEATAQEEVDTEDSILKLLKHTQKHYLNALEISLSNSDLENVRPGNIASLSTSVLKGHFDILELLSTTKDTTEDESPEEPTEFSITKIINEHIALLSSIIKEESFYTIIKNIHPSDNETYQLEVTYLLERIELIEEYKVCSYYNILLIILKELMVNALENIDIKNPLFTVDVKQEKRKTIIEIENSISDFTLNNVKKNYTAFKNRERISKRFGWWVICRLSELAEFTVEIDKLDTITSNKIFKVKIGIRDEEY